MEIRKFHDELIKLFSIELEEFPGIKFYKDPSEYKGLEFAQSVDGNDFFWLNLGSDMDVFLDSKSNLSLHHITHDNLMDDSLFMLENHSIVYLCFDQPFSMVSGSSLVLAWDFEGEYRFLGTHLDDCYPVIYCAISEKNFDENIFILFKKIFASGFDFLIGSGPTLGPYIQTELDHDQIIELVRLYLDGGNSWRLEFNECLDQEERENKLNFSDWIKEQESIFKSSIDSEQVDDGLMIFKDKSANEITKHFKEKNFALNENVKKLILHFIVSKKINKGPFA